jgi:hypothetical protein
MCFKLSKRHFLRNRQKRMVRDCSKGQLMHITLSEDQDKTGTVRVTPLMGRLSPLRQSEIGGLEEDWNSVFRVSYYDARIVRLTSQRQQLTLPQIKTQEPSSFVYSAQNNEVARYTKSSERGKYQNKRRDKSNVI